MATATETAPLPSGDTPSSLRESTYRALKARLLRGEFAAGERLAETRLADELGVSRTPVRETLARLHSEGFVQRYEGGGGFVPVLPDLQSIHELYEVRFALEHWAMNRPRHTGVPHDRDRLLALRDAWLAVEVPADDDAIDPAIVDLDEEFHIGLAGASGNHELVEQLRTVNARIRPVRTHDFLEVDRIEAAVTEHLHLLEPLLEGDVDEADARLTHHFEVTRALVERSAAQAIAAMVTRRR